MRARAHTCLLFVNAFGVQVYYTHTHTHTSQLLYFKKLWNFKCSGMSSIVPPPWKQD